MRVWTVHPCYLDVPGRGPGGGPGSRLPVRRGQGRRPRLSGGLEETEGQLLYEWGHLKGKLRRRDPGRYRRCRSVTVPLPHSLFRIVRGGVRAWKRR